ncbi:MAG: glycosyltransferase family 1 protein [Gemmatales bacterium]|nr:glycosyltransferase family 4 protein [Gemmatales bacterium]MDW7993720.1 glycosyltransferase family 1 protein [Gemmatales bacterium]
MQVLLNTWTGFGPPAGIGHYAQQLAQALQQTATDEDHIHIFPPDELAQLSRQLTSPLRSTRAQLSHPAMAKPMVRLVPRSASRWLRTCATPIRDAFRWTLGQCLRRYCRRVHAQLYHEPNFVPLCWDLPTIITVHDLSPLLFPHWHPDYRVRWLEKHWPRCVSHAHHILTVSQFTKTELTRLGGVSPERITVTYPGIRACFQPQKRPDARRKIAKLGLPTNFLLYVGTLEPRKNLETVLRAYLHLPRSHRQQVPFVLAGKYGWGADSLLELLATTGVQEGVYHLGYVPEAWLPVLYNAARALVYPSHYEGFGLPPVEMLACGGRVIVSDLAIFRETLGPHATRIAPNDPDGWYRVLYRIVVQHEFPTEPDWNAVHWARRYSWQACAQLTWQTYKSPPLAIPLAA